MSSICPWLCTGGCSSTSAHSRLSQGPLWAEDTSAMPDHQVILPYHPLLLVIFSKWLIWYIIFNYLLHFILWGWNGLHSIGIKIWFRVVYGFEILFFLLQIWYWHWAPLCNHGPLWPEGEEEGQFLMLILKAMKKSQICGIIFVFWPFCLNPFA